MSARGGTSETPDGYGDDHRTLEEEEARVRSKLSNERTFAAWIRTATAVSVVGLAIARFLALENGNALLFFILGGGYVLAGTGLFWFAAYNYFHGRRQMKRADFHAPKRFLIAIAVVLSLLGLGVIVGVALQVFVTS